MESYEFATSLFLPIFLSYSFLQSPGGQSPTFEWLSAQLGKMR